MRTAAIGALLVALFFSAWQFVLSGPAASPRLPLLAPPVPTPSRQSAQSTSTIIHFQDCQTVIYPVRKTDTLLSIARQFSVSKDTIMKLNRLQTDVVSPPMELLIPTCHLTPTSTFHPVTFTTTFTPLINFTTSPPGG